MYLSLSEDNHWNTTLSKYQYLREFAHVLSQIADIYLKYWKQSKLWIDVKCQTLNLVLQGDEVFKLLIKELLGVEPCDGNSNI